MPGPHESQPARRSAILSFEVTGPEGADVVVAVEHADPGDCCWSAAGSVPMIAPAGSALRVPRLKGEVRLRVTGDPAEVRVLPPRWLPG
jgi:hypothetical protein